MPQEVPPLRITTRDVEVIATSLPSLQSLSLSGLDAAAPGQQECELQPLSQLTGLHDLSIAARQTYSASTLASISALKQLKSLGLQLVEARMDSDFLGVFPHLSSLWGLSHLAHLSCVRVDMAPLYNDILYSSLVIDLTMGGNEDEYNRMITTLAGCRQLTSLHLPWANLASGAAERLAAELPQLTQLSVGDLQPINQMPSCSWRELTLCGKDKLLSRTLLNLPLEGLDRLLTTQLTLPTSISSSDDVDNFISLMEQCGPLLAAKLQAANIKPRVRLDFIQGLPPAETSRVIASLAFLDAAVDAFSFCTRLEGYHIHALAAAFPRLAHLAVADPGHINDDAWASVGILPSLKTFSTMQHGKDFVQPQHLEPFQPRHMALLASSVTRSVTVVVAQSDAEAAAAALEALQAAGHVGAGFITLFPREA